MKTLLKNDDFSFLKKNCEPREERVTIDFLVLWVGTRCSLRCRDCGNLIPYAKPERFDLDLVISDMIKMIKLCKINNLQIQGGEPFLHPFLHKMLTAIDNFDIPKISISTNGTVNISEKTILLIKNIKHRNFEIRVSSYKCVKDKQRDFFNRMKNNNIKCSTYNFKHNGFWVNQGSPDTGKNDNDIEVQRQYFECAFNNCVTLANGELFRCGRGKLSLEIFGINRNAEDVLDIRNIHENQKGSSTIGLFLENKKFKEYCRYCLGTKEKIPPAIQLDSGLIH